MNIEQKKLDLKKIKISKLTNAHLIQGGSGDPENPETADYAYTCYRCGTGQTVVQSSACERDPDGLRP